MGTGFQRLITPLRTGNGALLLQVYFGDMAEEQPAYFLKSSFRSPNFLIFSKRERS
jgi:hypothetical protein